MVTCMGEREIPSVSGDSRITRESWHIIYAHVYEIF